MKLRYKFIDDCLLVEKGKHDYLEISSNVFGPQVVDERGYWTIEQIKAAIDYYLKFKPVTTN